MKKLTAVLSALTIALCTCVQAQGNDNQNVNPLNAARAFALKSPAYFNCYLQAYALVGDSWQQTTMKFVVRKSDFAITNMEINGVSIPLPKPIYGIPLGSGGMFRDVYISVSAMTASGEYAGNGYGQIAQLYSGDSIEVTINPADIRHEVPVNVERYGSDIQVQIDGFIAGYGYGVSDGKFYLYMPPVGGKYHYILRRWSTGEVIGEGYVEPFKDIVIPDNGYFGIRYAGDVIGVDFDSDWVTVPALRFLSTVPTDAGTNVQATVIFTDVGRGGLELIISADVDIIVQKASAQNGDMPVLALEYRSIGNEWYTETRVNTVEKNVGKVVITIVPRQAWSGGNGPWLNLHKYLDKPSAPVTGGKG